MQTQHWEPLHAYMNAHTHVERCFYNWNSCSV